MPTIPDCKPGFDHDWEYDPGEPDVGCFACWVCRVCGEVDVGREPPSDEPEDH